jgi:hypothetical protein
VTSAAYALNSLTQSSDNRCKAAIKAGAMQQLARLLAPGNTVCAGLRSPRCTTS